MTLHDLLRRRAADLPEGATLGWVLDHLGTDVPGWLVVTVALPSVLPLPGIGNVTGSLLCILALCMAQGRSNAPLPERFTRLTLPAKHTQRLLHTLAWVHEQGHRRLRSRWSGWCSPLMWRWMSLSVAAMGVVIFLPIPLGNVLGTIVLVALGIGQVFRDGLVVAASAVLSLMTVGYTVGVTWGLAYWAVQLMAWFGTWL